MTTSYDAEAADSSSVMPQYNADGNQTWNPSVGIHYKPNSKKRESYGGIIAALVDQAVRANGMAKSYPENFGGIIAAIQDLGDVQYKPGSDVGEKPPGGNIIININTGEPIWIETDKPENGQLWFDTRQGRMFVYVDDDWYQTNGGDGIPIVTPDALPPEIEYAVPGQLWYDRGGDDLYIFSGDYQADDGSINQSGDGALVWKLVADLNQDFIQTTGTLPLTAVGPRVTSLEDYTYLPDIDLSPDDDGNYSMSTQKDYNEWLFEALVSLDQGLSDHQPVYVGEAPPPNTLEEPLAPGTLWYDTESLELSIWYTDDNSGQWVPTSTAYMYDDDIAALGTRLDQESRLREMGLHNLQEKIEAFNAADAAEVQQINDQLNALQTQVNAIQIPDITDLIDTDELNEAQALQNQRISDLEDAQPDYTVLMSRNEVEQELQQLETMVATRASVAQVQEVAAQIPDVSGFVTQQHIDNSIAGITVDYLPRSGGIVNGSFVIQKTDYAAPAFDFTSNSWDSAHALKFVSNGPGTPTTTFGTTDKAWEYAWDFANNEDFCWVYNDSNKVFSITKEGPACSTLYLGDLRPNDNNGRVIFNKIDVKERLNTYQSALEQVRQGVANATDFDSLKANIISALANV